MTKAQHSSDSGVFGPRAFFRTAFPSPAVLVIDDIKRHDAATYRCRVDFRQGQTRSFRYNLTVIGEYRIRGFRRVCKAAPRVFERARSGISIIQRPPVCLEACRIQREADYSFAATSSASIRVNSATSPERRIFPRARACTNVKRYYA